jgi:hypothetical protein
LRINLLTLKNNIKKLTIPHQSKIVVYSYHHLIVKEQIATKENKF